MTVKVTTDIFCDFCPNWTHGCVSWKEQRRKARNISHNDGWKTARIAGKTVDMCPNCQPPNEEPIICNACGEEVNGPLQDGLCQECYCIPEMWGE